MTVRITVELTDLVGEICYGPNVSGVLTVRGPASGAMARDLLRRGYKVEAQAKHDAPVDTGRLQASIKVEEGTPESSIGVEIGSDVNYAHWVHDGTKYMRARPFLLRALDAAR